MTAPAPSRAASVPARASTAASSLAAATPPAADACAAGGFPIPDRLLDRITAAPTPRLEAAFAAAALAEARRAGHRGTRFGDVAIRPPTRPLPDRLLAELRRRRWSGRMALATLCSYVNRPEDEVMAALLRLEDRGIVVRSAGRLGVEMWSVP